MCRHSDAGGDTRHGWITCRRAFAFNRSPLFSLHCMNNGSRLRHEPTPDHPNEIRYHGPINKKLAGLRHLAVRMQC